jgi:hypothetical protein
MIYVIVVSWVSLLKSLESMLERGFIIDPSLLSRIERVHLIFYIKERYKSQSLVLPTILYQAISEENLEKLALVLKKWEWMVPFSRIKEHVESPHFQELMSMIVRSSSPASEFWRSADDPSISREIAREIREVGCRLGLPVVASARYFISWLRKEGVSVWESTSSHYKKFKRELRHSYQKHLPTRIKVRMGQVSVNAFFAYVTLTSTTVLPPPFNLITTLLTVPLTDKMYVAVVVDP